MGFDGARAQAQQARDFLVAVPFCDQLKYFAFTLRERIEPIRDAAIGEVPHVVVAYDLGDLRAETRLARGKVAHGSDQIRICGVLEHESMRTRL